MKSSICGGPRSSLGLVTAALLAVLGAVPEVQAARILPSNFSDQLVVGGLLDPVGIAFLPDGRLLVAERTGRLRFVVEGKLGAVDPIAEPESVLVTGSERGILGVAVDPGWPARPYLYIAANHVDASLRVIRYRASGDLSNSTSVSLFIAPESRFVVLRVPHLTPGRNGGTLRFGSDGMLYVSVGDDGSSCAAQDTVQLQGAIARLNVSGLPDGPGGPPPFADLDPGDNPWSSHSQPAARLVWALGLGNAYRFQVDPVSGAVLVGDRGSGQTDEVDWVYSAGANLGWPYFEGSSFVEAACVEGPPLAPWGPVYTYPLGGADGASGVVTADVYRLPGCGSCGFPVSYDGSIFLADVGAGFLRRLTFNGSIWTVATPVAGQPSSTDWGRGFVKVTDYLVGPDGALWFCYSGTGAFDGEVRRILYSPPNVSVGEMGHSLEIAFAPPAPSPSRGGRVRFSCRVAREATLQLSLLDSQGRRVRVLAEPSRVAPGAHEWVWDGRAEDGSEVRPGIYRARLVVDGRVLERHLPVLR